MTIFQQDIISLLMHVLVENILIFTNIFDFLIIPINDLVKDDLGHEGVILANCPFQLAGIPDHEWISGVSVDRSNDTTEFNDEFLSLHNLHPSNLKTILIRNRDLQNCQNQLEQLRDCYRWY